MKENKKYDPEDLNKLLQTKSYDQLLQEEKSFVNEHIASADDYMKMRSLILDLEDQEWDSTPDPNPRVKEFLMRKHKNERKGSMKIWLNGLFGFASPDTSWYQRPAFQLAMASGLILITVVSILQINTEKSTLAMNEDKSPTPKEIAEPTNRKNQIVIEKEELSAPAENSELENEQNLSPSVDKFENNNELEEIVKVQAESINEGLTPPIATMEVVLEDDIEQILDNSFNESEQYDPIAEVEITLDLENSNSSDLSDKNLSNTDSSLSTDQLTKDFLDEDIVLDDVSEEKSDYYFSELDQEENVASTLESIQEISISSTRANAKKKEGSKFADSSSKSLGQQVDILDQLFEAY